MGTLPPMGSGSSRPGVFRSPGPSAVAIESPPRGRSRPSPTDQRHALVESRVRREAHARFGGRARETGRPRGRYRALVRPYPSADAGRRSAGSRQEPAGRPLRRIGRQHPSWMASPGLESTTNGGSDLAFAWARGHARGDQGGGRRRLVQQTGADELAEAERREVETVVALTARRLGDVPGLAGDRG